MDRTKKWGVGKSVPEMWKNVATWSLKMLPIFKMYVLIWIFVNCDIGLLLGLVGRTSFSNAPC